MKHALVTIECLLLRLKFPVPVKMDAGTFVEALEDLARTEHFFYSARGIDVYVFIWQGINCLMVRRIHFSN